MEHADDHNRQQQKDQQSQQGQQGQQDEQTPCLLQLPAEAIENVLLWLEPTDIVSARRAEVAGTAARVSCTIPLAATCRTLHDLLLCGGGGAEGASPLLHRIIATWSETMARATLRCLPNGSDPRISLRLAATWARVCRSVPMHRTQEAMQHGGRQPRPLALLPLVASTTDHHYECIQATVKPPVVSHRFLRAEYWSSVSQQAETRDFLVYRLPGLCALTSVCIKAYEEMGVVFSWPQIRLHVFAALPSPAGEPALFRTAELSAIDTADYQEICFAQPILGRYLLIELIGKHRQQHSGTGWFVCVDHVTASGFQLLQAGPAVAPPPLPTVCRTATLLRPAVRRVQVLGYSQERMLYATTEIGAAASRFHPENAPMPKFVSPDDLQFSAEGEAARVIVEGWLGKGACAANAHKAAGGKAFQQEDFYGAMHEYSQALCSLWPNASPLYRKFSGEDDVIAGKGGAETRSETSIDCWTHRQATGLQWVCGAPALHTDALAVTLLSNCAESSLRAAVLTLTALETHTPVS